MTAPVAVVADLPRRAGGTGSWLGERGMGASIAVATISSTFGVVLVAATGYLAAVLRTNPVIGRSETAAMILGVLAVLLTGVAVYVAAVVTANTFATIVAGRTALIARLRLLGASAASQRTRLARQGLAVGAIGAAAGLGLGLAIASAGVAVSNRMLNLDLHHSVLHAALVVPAVAVVLTTWAAAWAGSRRVLAVTPLQALGATVEASPEAVARRTGRNALAIVLLVLGVLLLAGGIVLGLVSPFGVVVAFTGGILSFTGLALGAALVMPPILRAAAPLFGQSAPARLAAGSLGRHPERSSRMAIGVVIGVTLVMMFAVAVESTKAVLAAASGGAIQPELAVTIDAFAAIMMGLVAVSAVIAGVGLVNLLTLGIVQRRRELGLLRALGLSRAQVRGMVLVEAAQLTVTASALGIALGTVYGWAGAQSLLGSVPVSPEAVGTSTFVLPQLPLWPTVVVVAATAALTAIASAGPTRLATRVSPVTALAE